MKKLFIAFVLCISTSSCLILNRPEKEGREDRAAVKHALISGGSVYQVRTIFSEDYIGGAAFIGDFTFDVDSVPLDEKSWEGAWSGDRMAFVGEESSILLVSRSIPHTQLLLQINSSNSDVVSIHKCTIKNDKIKISHYFLIQVMDRNLRKFVASGIQGGN